MAVIGYVSIFPKICLICVHMPISGLLFPLFYWCNSMYMPNARVSVCIAVRIVGCKTWGIAMSESMFVAHFSFAHSCCFS